MIVLNLDFVILNIYLRISKFNIFSLNEIVSISVKNISIGLIVIIKSLKWKVEI